jgi:hypothetical protein
MNAVTTVEQNALAPTPATLLQMAVSQGADLDKLERLMAMQERWEASEARKAFTVAVTAFKAEPLTVFKRQTVDFSSAKGRTHYKHATLSDVTDVVGPAMAKHGLSYRWDVRQDGKTVAVDCVVTHALGHSERVSMSGPLDDSGNKNVIQQAGSTVTYLQRYTLLAVTGLATEHEKDDDGRRGARDDGGRGAPGVEEEPSEDRLLTVGQAAAMNGMPSLTAWWGSLTGRDRTRLSKQYPSLRKAAEAADADR